MRASEGRLLECVGLSERCVCLLREGRIRDGGTDGEIRAGLRECVCAGC